jgi:DNA-binding transcriptional regulator/RsmH inhibitor MraZ
MYTAEYKCLLNICVEIISPVFHRAGFCFGGIIPMPRGGYTFSDTPTEIWSAEVDDRNRIRVPSKIKNLVPWLNKMDTGGLECLATPGARGGLQIEPIESNKALMDRFRIALKDKTAVASDSAKKWVDAARLLATSWRVTLNVEPSQLRMTVPEPIRRAQLLPGPDGRVVVFAMGEILEVWDEPKWYEHVGRIAPSKTSLISKAIEDLEES